MVLYSLCSSSKGNCTYIGTESSGILIDAGMGIRNYRQSMQMAGLNPDGLRAIFVTHEHSDHISGLRRLTECFDVPVYGSKGTLLELLRKEAVSPKTKLYEINRKTACVGGFAVQAFHISHDCAEGLGYTIDVHGYRLGVCTDLGFVSEEVHDQLCSCNFVLLESNYDQQMLADGRYPAMLKRRIASRSGHLSNQHCAEQLERLVGSGVEHFMLGHLSKENNRPQLALELSVAYLEEHGMHLERDYTLSVAPERNPGRVVELC